MIMSGCFINEIFFDESGNKVDMIAILKGKCPFEELK